jgi:hypothetical protein
LQDEQGLCSNEDFLNPAGTASLSSPFIYKPFSTLQSKFPLPNHDPYGIECNLPKCSPETQKSKTPLKRKAKAKRHPFITKP